MATVQATRIPILHLRVKKHYPFAMLQGSSFFKEYDWQEARYVLGCLNMKNRGLRMPTPLKYKRAAISDPSV